MTSTHGGYREDSGRKVKPERGPLKSQNYWMAQKHLDLIAAWQHAHACSASEAVRQMIEHCKETRS